MTCSPAFEHFLRTGQQLTEEEWWARFERKFNQNHDPVNGQFTFAAGSPAQRPGARRAASARATPAAPAATPSPAARLRPISGYPETGKDSWRKANDAIFEKAASDFNARNGLKPGDARFMVTCSPDCYQSEVESGSFMMVG